MRQMATGQIWSNSKVYLKLYSHCACWLYQYGRVVVERARLRCAGYFVRTAVGYPIVRNPPAPDRSVITRGRTYCLL